MRCRIGILSNEPEFTALARTVAEEHGLEPVCEEAILGRAQAVARRWEAEGRVEVILARGAWASRLSVGLPVITVEVSGYEVAEAVYAARSHGSRIALVDHEAEPRSYLPERIGAMLGVELRLYLFRNEFGLRRQVLRAIRQGAQALVTAAGSGIRLAQQLGLPAVPVTATRPAVEAAVRRVIDAVGRARRAEAESRLARAVLARSRDGVVILGRRGEVTVCNAAAEAILGLPAEELLDRPARELAARYPAFAALYGDGAEAVGEPVRIRGREWVVSRMPVHLGDGVTGLVITCQPAAQIVDIEQKIRRQLHSRGLTARYNFDDLIVRSPALAATRETALRYAATDLTVLITGETGTGKELFAHAIHQASRRASGPFVAVNCAAIPESLLESELFGYDEGAFTGARKGGKPGLFELAHGGTLFLDEVGELPLSVQARLLRVLQSGEVRRVGGDRVIPVDVRVLAATNRPLQQAVQEGRFREDLYFRLSVLTLVIPPLRERLEDIPHLAARFLAEAARAGAPRHHLGEAELAVLRSYHWPGNVRQLRNVLLRYAVLATPGGDGAALLRRLLAEEAAGPGAASPPEPQRAAAVAAEPPLAAGAPVPPAGPASPPAPSASPPAPPAGADWIPVRVGPLDEMIREILRTLEAREGDRARVARILGISRTTVWRRLREHRGVLQRRDVLQN